MPWLQSRRFYAGLLIGLTPLLLVLLLATVAPGDRSDDTQRVLVRNYNECIPDSLAHQRTIRLLELLPADGVLVENFFGCCCCCDKDRREGQMERSGVQGQTSWRTPPGAAAPPSAAAAAPGAPAPPPADYLDRLEPRTAGFQVTSPGGLPAVEPVRRGLTPWLFLATLPLIRFVGIFDNDRDFPPGVICPDSGIPTGPNRPRC